MPCEGCAARAAEIDFLRAQNRELSDRLLAATSPQAFAQVTGKGLSPESGLERLRVGEETFVMIEGRAVRQADLDRFVGDRGGYLVDHQLVSTEEYERTLARAEEARAGNPMIERAASGSPLDA